MPSASPDVLDEKGLINIDLPCLVCNYNLRMQSHDGLCPECGAPVVQTADSRHSRFAPPRYVSALATGAGVSLLTIPLTILYPVAAIFLLLNASEAIPLVLSGPPAIILIMQGAGTFLLTAPVPAAHVSPEQTATRMLARLAIPVWIAGFSVVVAILLTSGFESALYSVLSSTFGPLATVAVVAVWPLAIMRHTKVLMSQVPRPRLERLLGIACTTILVPTILYALGSRIFPVPVVAIIGGITLIVVAMAYVLLLLAWVALSKAARQAASLAAISPNNGLLAV